MNTVSPFFVFESAVFNSEWKLKSGDFHIVSAFRGRFSQQIIHSFSSLVHNRYQQICGRDRRRLLSLMVEMGQNVLYHGGWGSIDGRSDLVGRGFLLVREAPGFLEVQSGNFALNAAARTVQRRIGLLNSSDRDEIRQLYREQLRGPLTEGRRGAGLGLLTIARICSANISTDSLKFSDRLQFLFIKALLQLENQQ